MAKCSPCSQLWCEVAYEPFASFSFWAAWPWDVDAWLNLLTKNEGLAYYEWHEAVLVEEHENLSKEEREAVEFWRRRSSGRTPIDHRTPRFVETSADLQKFLTP